MHYRRSIFTLIFLVIVFCLTVVNGQSAAIFSGPMDQVVAPGDTAYFNCHARGNPVLWYIDGFILHDKSPFMARGFTFSEELSNGVANYTITIVAVLINNNTRIECRARLYNMPDVSQVGTLIIAGPPLPPDLSLSVVHALNNTFTHTLHWDKPFTWIEFPIIEYTINVTNQSNGTVGTFSIPVTSNSTDSHFIYSVTSDGDYCYQFDIALSASNSIGESDSSTELTYHPIAIKEVEDIDMVVTLQSNGTSQFWIRFLAPEICPFLQIGVYNIAVYDEQYQLINIFGPMNYTQKSIQEQSVILKEVQSSLPHYYYEVNVSSIGVTQTLTRTFQIVFDKYSKINSTTLPEVHIPTCGTDQDIVAKDIKAIAIGAGAMLTLCLLLTVFSITVIAFCSCRKKRTAARIELETDGSVSTGSVASIQHRNPNERRPHNLRVEACNPIYEGVMYETTPGELFLSVPNTPAADSTSFSRYTFDTSPNLPPPRKTSVCLEANGDPYEKPQPVAQIVKNADGGSPTSKLGDEYMVMNSNK